MRIAKPKADITHEIERKIRSEHAEGHRLDAHFIRWALTVAAQGDDPCEESAKIVARSLGAAYAEELARIAHEIGERLKDEADRVRYNVLSLGSGNGTPSLDRPLRVEEIRKKNDTHHWDIRQHPLVSLSLALYALEWALNDPGDSLGPCSWSGGS